MDPPVRVHPFVWEPRSGRRSLTVACELALRLVHGAEAQFVEPIRFYDDDLAAIADADLRAPYKPRTDVLLVGHAYSPASEGEVDRLLVRVRIGDYGKAIWAIGDRLWTREAGRLVPSAPRKFRRMLLSSERAARSAENPRGVDPDQMPMEHRIAAANIEAALRGQEAHVGPVPPGAARRASLVHPVAAPWLRALLSGQRAGPAPEGFPFTYFNIAPVDQQVEAVPLGSAIVLEHMHPERAVFSSRLPASRPRAFVFDPATRAHVEIDLRCDTVWIDADREMVSLVFRGVVPVAHAEAASQVSVRVEAFAREEPAARGATSTLSLPASRPPAAPTFGAPLAAPVFGSKPTAPTFSGGAPAARAFGGTTAPVPLFEPPAAGARPFSGLPFAERAGGPAPPRLDPPLAGGNESTTAGETVRLARLDLDAARAARAARERQFITQEIALEGPVAATPFEGRVEQKAEQKIEHKVDDDTTQSLRAREMARVLAGVDVDDSSADAPTPAPFQHTEPTSSSNVTAVSDMSGVASLAPVRIVKLRPPRISPTPPPPLPPRPVGRAKPEALANGHEASPRPPAEIRPPAKVPAPDARPSAARLGALKLGLGKLQSSGGAERAKEAPPLARAEPTKPAVVEPEPPARVALPAESVVADPVTAEPEGARDERDEAPLPAAKEEPSSDELAREGTNDSRPRPVQEELTETSSSPRRAIEARTLEEAEADADRDAFEFPLPPSDGFEVDGVTLEHCAAIRAAMAMPGAERAAVLVKNDLDDATWSRIEKAHMARIDQETSKGVMDLLSRYDASYVAAQDKLRTPIGVKEYARIVHARGHGNLAETMAELAIPRSELMRLDRVWKLRRAAYPEVDKAIDAAVATLGKERR